MDLYELTPDAVDIPAEQLIEAVVLEDATAVGEEIRCVIPSEDLLGATDPMVWQPWMGADGLYYPKKGDRAVLAFQVEGPPVIVLWRPSSSAAADAAISGGGSSSDAFFLGG